MYACMHVSVCIRVWVCMYVYMYNACVYLYICILYSIYVSIFICLRTRYFDIHAESSRKESCGLRKQKLVIVQMQQEVTPDTGHGRVAPQR